MRILILNKTHLGSGTYNVLAIFKYTKAADGLWEKNPVDGTNDPHIHQFTYRVSIDLVVNNTAPKRKAALLAALTPVGKQYRDQTVADRAKADAASAAGTDLNVDQPTDAGFDAGATV